MDDANEATPQDELDQIASIQEAVGTYLDVVVGPSRTWKRVLITTVTLTARGGGNFRVDLHAQVPMKKSRPILRQYLLFSEAPELSNLVVSYKVPGNHAEGFEVYRNPHKGEENTEGNNPWEVGRPSDVTQSVQFGCTSSAWLSLARMGIR